MNKRVRFFQNEFDSNFPAFLTFDFCCCGKFCDAIVANLRPSFVWQEFLSKIEWN
jgi:hypothetical protein